MIIAVDYDGTLDINGTINMGLVARLKHEQAKGGIIILWTCRGGKRLNEAIQNLRKVGFIPNLVNENAAETIAMFGYNPRKVWAHVYIDDKNLN